MNEEEFKRIEARWKSDVDHKLDQLVSFMLSSLERERALDETIKQLKEWADKLPPDAKVELMLQEVAKANGYNLYKTPEHGGWVEVQGEHLRVTMEHPERRPAQVAEKLLK